jgi:hypothetical protein
VPKPISDAPPRRATAVDVDGSKLSAFDLEDLYASLGTLHLEIEDSHWTLPPQRAAWLPGLDGRVLEENGVALLLATGRRPSVR